MHHVAALRAALGADAVAMPTINLNESFTAAATAAGIIKAGETFNPVSTIVYDTSLCLRIFATSSRPLPISSSELSFSRTLEVCLCFGSAATGFDVSFSDRLQRCSSFDLK